MSVDYEKNSWYSFKKLELIMKIVKIRERNREFQIYEKESKKIVFRGKTKQACFDFLGDHFQEYAIESTQEKGVLYVY